MSPGHKLYSDAPSGIRQVRRFRNNPVEVAIFSVVFLVLVNSVYQLFYGHAGFSPAALTQMNSNPISEGRHLASVQQPLMDMEIQCSSEGPNQETSANKLRLKGSLCGAEFEGAGSSLIKSSVINTANQFNATVFTDVASGKFSTDYIPLQAGENLIRFEFSYFGGKTASQNLHVIRH